MNIHLELARVAGRIGPDLEKHYSRLMDDAGQIPASELAEAIARSEQVALNAYSRALMDQVRFVVRDYFYELTDDAATARDLYARLESGYVPPEISRMEIDTCFNAAEAPRAGHCSEPQRTAGSCSASGSWRAECRGNGTSDGMSCHRNGRGVREFLIHFLFGRSSSDSHRSDLYSEIPNPAHIEPKRASLKNDERLREQVRGVLRIRRDEMEQQFQRMVDDYCMAAKRLAMKSRGSHDA